MNDARGSRFLPEGGLDIMWQGAGLNAPVNVQEALDRLVQLFPITSRKTGTYTAQHNEVVFVDTGAGGFTLNLPGIVSGRFSYVGVKRLPGDTNTLTIDGAGTEQIDGNLTVPFSTDGGGLLLISDGGSNWYRLAQF